MLKVTNVIFDMTNVILNWVSKKDILILGKMEFPKEQSQPLIEI